MNIDRRQLFGILATALGGFLAPKAPPAIPVQAIPIQEDITVAILRRHRQTIIDAFNSDSYFSNCLSIQHEPVYDSFLTPKPIPNKSIMIQHSTIFSDVDTLNANIRKAWLQSQSASGSFQKYIEAESGINASIV